MTESNAALVEEPELSNDIDLGQEQNQEQESPKTEPTESAPVEAESKVDDGVQQRINKEVSRRYTEQRRADAAEEELKKLRAATPVTAGKAPTLEEFDHDEEAFSQASIKHQVAEAVKAERVLANTEANAATAAETQRVFNERITALNRPDFADIANAIPELPAGVAGALTELESGPELIVHLGTHLDLADKLASMSPAQAMMELGRISANMSTKPDAKISAAPDPIETLSSGGSISKERGPAGAKFE